MATVADKECVEFARECVRLDVPDEGFGVAAVGLEHLRATYARSRRGS